MGKVRPGVRSDVLAVLRALVGLRVDFRSRGDNVMKQPNTAGATPDPAPVPLRDLVVRLCGLDGRVEREWRVPLTELGPHTNTQACPSIDVTIETHSPRTIGTLRISPWGDGQ